MKIDFIVIETYFAHTLAQRSQGDTYIDPCSCHSYPYWSIRLSVDIVDDRSAETPSKRDQRGKIVRYNSILSTPNGNHIPLFLCLHSRGYCTNEGRI